MNKLYQKPEIKAVQIKAEDIIRTSGGSETGTLGDVEKKFGVKSYGTFIDKMADIFKD